MEKEYHVKKSQESAEIMNYKRFHACPSLAIYVRPRREDHARIGVPVGKKMGKAVVRNKVKCQVRMTVQGICSFEEKFDTIMLVRVKYHEESYTNNKRLSERLAKKVKV